MKPFVFSVFILPQICMMACNSGKHQADAFPPDSFGYDAAYLSEYQSAIVLSSPDSQAQILVCPAYQGRIMTSTAGGRMGKSYGWLNYNQISAAETSEHINAYGGEDRFWMGPEGGQFSIFFAPGSEFVYDQWQTPAAIDSEPFELVSKASDRALFRRQMVLTNYSGVPLSLTVERELRLLDRTGAEALLGRAIPSGLRMVAFQSENAITNTGTEAWTREGGALSIWILGMFKPSPTTTILIPYREGPDEELGPVVNDAYFGVVPEERLHIEPGRIYFRGDGRLRSKIGVSPKRALPFAASFDAAGGLLTIVHFSLPDEPADYVNSMWELQEDPFSGDVVNSYNDGPVNGQMMGPFYELESSSPAAFLDPRQTMRHIHSTLHLEGDPELLSEITRHLFGVDTGHIAAVFSTINHE